MFRWILFLSAVLAVTILVLRARYPLPSLEGHRASTAIPASAETAIGAAVLSQQSAHPGASGILPLGGGVDAFAARVVLARAAEQSIDAQYYIWQDDLTGIRLLSELQAAARRGVRVRLLVDDNGTPALDQELAALDRMDMAEVRLFNPFVLRSPRNLSYLFDFPRLNRRMHNKSFTVDGIVTIVGGRNIGDVYFETGAGHLFFDLDVLAAGPAAADVGADFDRYWNSASAYPARILIAAEPGSDTRLAGRDAALRSSKQAAAYAKAVAASDIVTRIRNGTLDLEWVPARLFSDDPAKALGVVGDDDLMIRRLMDEIATPAESVDLVSAYFIPGPNGARQLADFARGGARVRTLTNALEATDVAPVHAGYANYRDQLVDAGVEVYELRSEGGDRRSVNDLGVEELSRASLHAKTLVVDRKRVFIGSFNFDPRSKRLNCEMGFLIDSPKLAGGMADWLDDNLARLAYRVTRDGDGGLAWTAERPDGTTGTLTTEPNTTLPLRLIVRLIGWLPVEWLL